MSVTIIAAVARDGAIGIKGDTPFHISADLRRFKELTMGHPLVMGRKTFESLPGGALPGRRNIVVTRNAGWQAPGAECYTTLADAIAAAESNTTHDKAATVCNATHDKDIAAGDDVEVMVIGGGEIYRQALPLADRLLLTIIDADVPDADTHFPALSPDVWRVAAESPVHTDPRTGVPYRFIDYRRR